MYFLFSCQQLCELWGGAVAQLAERWANMPLRQVWFPGAARDFSPWVNFQYTLTVSTHTHEHTHTSCATACIKICAHFKIPLVPSMHRRLGSMIVTAGFPRGKQPKFPMGEIPVGQYSCKYSCIYFLTLVYGYWETMWFSCMLWMEWLL